MQFINEYLQMKSHTLLQTTFLTETTKKHHPEFLINLLTLSDTFRIFIIIAYEFEENVFRSISFLRVRQARMANKKKKNILRSHIKYNESELDFYFQFNCSHENDCVIFKLYRLISHILILPLILK